MPQSIKQFKEKLSLALVKAKIVRFFKGFYIEEGLILKMGFFS
ncbi:MAG: hypothetical protein Ct9H300mP28_17610 [Pseudomonadota bacterium]|nr:MAG: hypothetical protein Ct9H300mP28_17610 [Pseudomonadota bacterium]